MDEQVQQPSASPTDASPAQAMSPWGSPFRVFVAPKRVFQALSPKPAFLIPLLAVLVIHMGVGLVVSGSDVVREATISKLEEKGAPQEQIDATERMMGSPLMIVLGTVGAGVGVAFVIFLGAALLYFMGNLMLGARLNFSHFVCVSTYGQVVGLVDALVRTGLMLAKNTLHVQTGLGAFLGGEPGFPLRVLDTLSSPLLLWAAAIQALGVSVFAKKGFGFGVLCALPGFVLVAILSGIQG